MSKYQKYLDCEHIWNLTPIRSGEPQNCNKCGVSYGAWRWIQKIAALEAQRDELLAACEAQSRLIEAHTLMLTNYRLGRNSKEKTLKVMDSRHGIEAQARKAIANAKGAADESE